MHLRCLASQHTDVFVGALYRPWHVQVYVRIKIVVRTLASQLDQHKRHFQLSICNILVSEKVRKLTTSSMCGHGMYQQLFTCCACNGLTH